MPLIDTHFQQVYGDKGFLAIAIHTQKAVLYAQTVCVDTNMSYPMVLDVDEQAMNQYTQQGVPSVPFPLGYLIDKQGTVRHIYIDEEPSDEELTQHVEQLLAE